MITPAENAISSGGRSAAAFAFDRSAHDAPSAGLGTAVVPGTPGIRPSAGVRADPDLAGRGPGRAGLGLAGRRVPGGARRDRPVARPGLRRRGAIAEAGEHVLAPDIVDQSVAG
ncbi:hypothetical protein FHS43_005918 [Streptosporangium becharense]|uniref:Uncharacterized protein n=1 Tax=Streptosporangium becharense TaxID=1816182 RepID=A0A7W9MK80_9ACTN|nr:hypothetical protein [Streptosporangium becharense]MBB2914606.1 hypothetical protein [Streptosporangium becharense]MBB5823451.1 hypothetical protein [Streptosporangium becharense]